MFRKAALVAARLPTLSDSSNQSSCIGSIGIGAVTECAVQHCIVVWKAAVATLSDSANHSSCIGSTGIGAVTECAVQHCIVVWKAAVATAPLAAAPVGLGSVCRHLTGVV